MTDPETERIDIDGVQAAHRFLIEVAFVLICRLDPHGEREAFQGIQTWLLDTIAKSVANEFPKCARDVRVSDAAEQELKTFLASLSMRIR